MENMSTRNKGPEHGDNLFISSSGLLLVLCVLPERSNRMRSCSPVHVCLCALVAGIYNAVNAFVLRDQVRTFPPLYSQQQETKPCFYREPTTRQWKPRINIVDLYVGQQLNGTVVQELLDGKTGPKRTYYIILLYIGKVSMSIMCKLVL